MNNLTHSFWKEIRKIIDDGFTQEGLNKLEEYGEWFNNRKILYKRFTPQEQYGCTTGGVTHVIASLLAGAEIATSGIAEESLSERKIELQLAKKQIESIKHWAKKAGVWFNNIDHVLRDNLGDFFAQGGEADVYDNGASVIKTISLDYFIQPIYALDRITLHNTWFPETRLKVIGFAENSLGEFRIIVEQPYIQGQSVLEEEINNFLVSLGFQLKNKRNWTYATSEIYLSDVHDENVLKSSKGTIFIIDCDIRINSPILRTGGTRKLTTDILLSD